MYALHSYEKYEYLNNNNQDLILLSMISIYALFCIT